MPCIQSVDSTGASSFLRMLLLVRELTCMH